MLVLLLGCSAKLETLQKGDIPGGSSFAAVHYLDEVMIGTRTLEEYLGDKTEERDAGKFQGYLDAMPPAFDE